MPQLHTMFEPEQQFIQQQPGFDTGGALGQGMATGIGALLQGLAQAKVQGMQQRAQVQNQRDYAQALGMGGLYGQSQGLEQLMGQQEQPRQGLQQMLGGDLGDGVRSGDTTPVKFDPKTGTMVPELPPGVESGAMTLPDSQGRFVAPEAEERQQAPTKENRYEQKIQKQLAQPSLTIPQLTKIAEMGQKRQEAINKETAPVIKDIMTEKKGADDGNRRLKRMMALINRGDLGAPIGNAVIKTASEGIFGFGIDLTNLMTADAQEFSKLSADFAKNAKDFFPGRVTDNDLKVFMKTVPNLAQSKAGMHRLINSMEAVNETKYVKYDALKQILQANGGRRPDNLEILIEEITAPKLDKLAQQFITGEFIEESAERQAPYPKLPGQDKLTIRDVPLAGKLYELDRRSTNY